MAPWAPYLASLYGIKAMHKGMYYSMILLLGSCLDEIWKDLAHHGALSSATLRVLLNGIKPISLCGLSLNQTGWLMIQEYIHQLARAG